MLLKSALSGQWVRQIRALIKVIDINYLSNSRRYIALSYYIALINVYLLKN